MKNNNLVKLFKSQKPTAGYTLMELLIGASISVVVIGAAGMGLMNLMRGNLAATNQTERREEVNRALEFISDEVRRAEKIELDPNNASIIPDTELPTGFDRSKSTIVLALDVPENLGQDIARVDDKVIYYVGEKPDSKWIGPNVIYRYGPPLDTSGGSYTNGTWVNQPLIDRVNDQTLSPSCASETAIAAQGFAACVNTASQKIARVYVNGKFSEKAGDEYQADVQVFARSEAVKLSGTSSPVTFTPPTGSTTGTSKVKILASQMGCSDVITDYIDGSGNSIPNGGTCDITTTIAQSDGNNFIINPNDSSEKSGVKIDNTNIFTVTVTPSVGSNVSSAFESYFDNTGAIRTDGVVGEQNNNTPIIVDIDLREDYLTGNPASVRNSGDGGIFSEDQVKLLGDKTNINDLDSWNLDTGTQQTNFDKLKKILGDNNLLDSDGNVTLASNQYVLIFEVGQKDDTHKGFDGQDHMMLITVE